MICQKSTEHILIYSALVDPCCISVTIINAIANIASCIDNGDTGSGCVNNESLSLYFRISIISHIFVYSSYYFSGTHSDVFDKPKDFISQVTYILGKDDMLYIYLMFSQLCYFRS